MNKWHSWIAYGVFGFSAGWLLDVTFWKFAVLLVMVAILDVIGSLSDINKHRKEKGCRL